VTLVGAGAATLAGAACGPPGAERGAGTAGSASPAAQSTKVTFFSPASDKLGDEIMRDQSNKFNAQNKNVQIDYAFTATDDNYKQYTTAMVAGSAPDVLMTYTYSPVPPWQAKGLIRDLDQYRKEMNIKQEDYFANIWSMITFGGKLYGFVQEFDANLLAMVNESVQRAGLDPTRPPRTMDELDDWNARVVKKEGGTLSQVGIVPWLHGGYDLWAGLHGGGYRDNAAGKFTINRKENVASLAWMAKAAKVYGSFDDVDAMHKAQSITNDAALYASRAALKQAGEYAPIVWQKDRPEVKYTIAFWPTASGVTYGTGQTGGGNIFVLPKDAPHPREAVQVMKWFAGPEMVLDWNVRANNLPPVKSVANDPKFREAVPLMSRWLDMIKIDQMKPPIASPLVDYFNSKRGEWATKAIKGEVAPQQALDELQKDLDNQVRLFEQTKALPS
jgi:multiple sugar transport system substrate-binding protein